MDPASPPPSTPLPPPPGSWWSRNWKWLVPTGCLGMLLLVAVFVGAIMMIVMGALKSSDVYGDSLRAAAASPAVTEELGEPVEAGWFLTGSIHVTGPSGSADIAIPLSGPKGEGTLFVVATKSAGRWEYSTRVVEIAGTGERIEIGESAER